MSEDRPADGTDAPGKAKAKRPQPEWAKLPDGELLKLRIKDLGLSLEGSGLEKKICHHIPMSSWFWKPWGTPVRLSSNWSNSTNIAC